LNMFLCHQKYGSYVALQPTPDLLKPLTPSCWLLVQGTPGRAEWRIGAVDRGRFSNLGAN
jgi:hypothetical protein